MAVSSNDRTCSSKFFGALGLMIWPIVSIVLGLITGTIFGLFMTVVVFIYTLVRTPLHTTKMMYVTATTTTECFQPYHYLDPFLRIAVLLLVPLVHVLWLVGVTVVAVTYGTLYYIAKATKMFYLHTYRTMFSKLESNAKLEKDSPFGSYVKTCRDFMKSDEPSYATLYVLKAICAIVPGVPLGLLPLIPYTVGVLVITIYRFPINLYKTMKIALCTVVLQWELKLVALVMLPFAHILFPLVAFVTAMVGSFCYFTFATTQSIFEGKNPFEKWYKVKDGFKKYYQAHQQFIGKDCCGRFDHPTGIPSGWEGESYGIPIQQILRWQWDFLVCFLFLFVVGVPICFVGSAVIFVVKLVPGTVSWWRLLWKEASEKSAAQILGCWTFYLLAFVLVPVGAVLVSIGAVLAGTLCSFSIPGIYLEGGYSVGCSAPFKLLHDVDGWDFFDLGDGFYVLLCLPRWAEEDTSWGQQDNDVGSSSSTDRNSDQERMRYSEAHWDRFANHCIRSASGLLAKKWITLEDLQCIEPSVAQAIPAIALLEILVDTVTDTETREDDILWTIDGTLCKGKDRPPLENVAAFLLPKVYQVKRLLSKTEEKEQIFCATQNVKTLTAILCSNTDETTDALKEFVASSQQIDDDAGQPHSATNRQIRTQLIDLSLAILQVKPFRDRMSIIFDYGYIETGIDDEDSTASYICAEDTSSTSVHEEETKA